MLIDQNMIFHLKKKKKKNSQAANFYHFWTT